MIMSVCVLVSECVCVCVKYILIILQAGLSLLNYHFQILDSLTTHTDSYRLVHLMAKATIKQYFTCCPPVHDVAPGQKVSTDR